MRAPARVVLSDPTRFVLSDSRRQHLDESTPPRLDENEGREARSSANAWLTTSAATTSAPSACSSRPIPDRCLYSCQGPDRPREGISRIPGRNRLGGHATPVKRYCADRSRRQSRCTPCPKDAPPGRAETISRTDPQKLWAVVIIAAARCARIATLAFARSFNNDIAHVFAHKITFESKKPRQELLPRACSARPDESRVIHQTYESVNQRVMLCSRLTLDIIGVIPIKS